MKEKTFDVIVTAITCAAIIVGVSAWKRARHASADPACVTIRDAGELRPLCGDGREISAAQAAEIEQRYELAP